MILRELIHWLRRFIRLLRVQGVLSVPLMACHWTTSFSLVWCPLVIILSICPWLPTTWLKCVRVCASTQ